MADEKIPLVPVKTTVPTTLGSPVAPNPDKVLQTTILPNTTLNPNSSITNPVMLDGSPAPPEVKRAVIPGPVVAGAVAHAPATVEVQTTLADKPAEEKK